MNTMKYLTRLTLIDNKKSCEIKEPFKLLMLCYNATREYDIEDEKLEFTMDVLDKLL